MSSPYIWKWCGTSDNFRFYQLLLITMLLRVHFGGVGKKAFFQSLCLKKTKVGLCSRRWPEDNWCCLVAAVVVLIVVAAVGIASWHDAAAVFFGCVRQDVTHDTFIGTSWLRNYRQMWLSGYSALTLETSAPGLPGYYVIVSTQMQVSNVFLIQYNTYPNEFWIKLVHCCLTLCFKFDDVIVISIYVNK